MVGNTKAVLVSRKIKTHWNNGIVVLMELDLRVKTSPKLLVSIPDLLK